MEVIVNVGKPVIEENPVNTYVLTVSYEHGDADGDSETTASYSIDQLDQLKLDLAGFELITGQELYLDECEHELRALYESMGVEDADTQVGRFQDNFYEGDHTCDYSRAAAFAGYELFFYDENGVKHEVEVLISE